MASYSAYQSVAITATGTAYPAGTRLSGLYVLSVVGGGTLTFSELVGGIVRFSMVLPASATGTVWINLPDGGIRFNTGIVATLPAGVNATLIIE